MARTSIRLPMHATDHKMLFARSRESACRAKSAWYTIPRSLVTTHTRANAVHRFWGENKKTQSSYRVEMLQIFPPATYHCLYLNTVRVGDSPHTQKKNIYMPVAESTNLHQANVTYRKQNARRFTLELSSISAGTEYECACRRSARHTANSSLLASPLPVVLRRSKGTIS